MSFFLICFIVLIIIIGVKFFHSLVTAGQSNNSYNQETDKQLREDSREDSQGDGLVLFDDPIFPEEFDKEFDD
jgi:hypothetical protein